MSQESKDNTSISTKNSNFPIIRNALIALAAFLLFGSLFFLVQNTGAYFTDLEEEENVFTFGEVDIIPYEPNFPASTDPLVPNEEVPKDPKIANDGENDALVFLEVKMPVEEFSIVSEDGKTYETETTEIFDVKTGTGNSAQIGFNSSDWEQVAKTEGAAGENNIYVFAYKKVLPPSTNSVTNVRDNAQVENLTSKTSTLFDSVKIKNYLEGSLLGEYNILVNGYAIQAQYLRDSAGLDITSNLYDESGNPVELDRETLEKVWSVCEAQIAEEG